MGFETENEDEISYEDFKGRDEITGRKRRSNRLNKKKFDFGELEEIMLSGVEDEDNDDDDEEYNLSV